ncbi:hypothetical protein ACSSUR_10595 [Pseudomonas cedrina]|uniref:hypothetical protein n=1 Tax=Pseudomonas cedrina TaxID=651740 RepID=UPI003ED8E16F
MVLRNSRTDQLKPAVPFQQRLAAHRKGVGRQLNVDLYLGGQPKARDGDAGYARIQRPTREQPPTGRFVGLPGNRPAIDLSLLQAQGETPSSPELKALRIGRCTAEAQRHRGGTRAEHTQMQRTLRIESHRIPSG